MRRLAVLLALLGLLVAGAVARGDDPAPRVTLEPYCDDGAGHPDGAYGFRVRLEGFAPHEHVTGDGTWKNGASHGFPIEVDENGAWTFHFGSGGALGTVRVTIHRAGGADLTATLEQPCELVLPGGSVEGKLRAGVSDTRIALTAVAGPVGEQPKGTVTETDKDGTRTGDVVCLACAATTRPSGSRGRVAVARSSSSPTAST
jgi:hypothetical protein